MTHMLHTEWGEVNLLKRLKEQGYFIWWGGKNDLLPSGTDLSEHCDVRFRATKEDYERWGCRPREGNHGGDYAWRGAPDGDNYFSFFKGKLDKQADSLYCDNDWANVLGAVDFIKHYEGDRPLCLYLPLTYPHPPYCVEEPWYSLTDRAAVPRRAQYPSNWEGKPAILKGIWENQRLQGWTEDLWTELRAVYYGMCSRVDHQFGMLLNTLHEKQMYHDSAIFFFSDHGDFAGDYGLVEKTQNTFEDCLSRVPFIVKPPAEVPVQPRVTNALVELIDFPATVYALTGIDPGYDHFGKSLLPLLSGQTDEHRDAVFCEGGRRLGEVQAMERETVPNDHSREHGLYSPRVRLQISDAGTYHTKAAMCRTSTRKYVQRLYEKDELYDLVADPMEEHNVIDDPAYQTELAALKERLLRWYMETCDIVPRQTDKR